MSKLKSRSQINTSEKDDSNIKKKKKKYDNIMNILETIQNDLKAIKTNNDDNDIESQKTIYVQRTCCCGCFPKPGLYWLNLFDRTVLGILRILFNLMGILICWIFSCPTYGTTIALYKLFDIITASDDIAIPCVTDIIPYKINWNLLFCIGLVDLTLQSLTYCTTIGFIRRTISSSIFTIIAYILSFIYPILILINRHELDTLFIRSGWNIMYYFYYFTTFGMITIVSLRIIIELVSILKTYVICPYINKIRV